MSILLSYSLLKPDKLWPKELGSELLLRPLLPNKEFLSNADLLLVLFVLPERSLLPLPWLC